MGRYSPKAVIEHGEKMIGRGGSPEPFGRHIAVVDDGQYRWAGDNIRYFLDTYFLGSRKSAVTYHDYTVPNEKLDLCDYNGLESSIVNQPDGVSARQRTPRARRRAAVPA
jgi:hypothetical protein